DIHASSGNLVITKPGGTADGHVMVAMIVDPNANPNGNPAVAPPAGWATLDGSPFTDNVNGLRGWIFTKTASGEGASFTFAVTKSAPDDGIFGVVAVYSFSSPPTGTAPNSNVSHVTW